MECGASLVRAACGTAPSLRFAVNFFADGHLPGKSRGYSYPAFGGFAIRASLSEIKKIFFFFRAFFLLPWAPVVFRQAA